MVKNKTRKKQRWKLVFLPFEVLFWIVAIVLIIYGIMNYKFPKKSINLFGIQHYVISSTSMDPLLKYGDLVFAKKLKAEKLKPNDVITFFADVDASGKKIILTHYFDSIEVDATGATIYRTRRAGTTTIDSWRVKEEDILGIYDFHIGKVGKVLLFFRSPLGKRILIIDILIISLIILIKDNYKKTRKENDESKQENKEERAKEDYQKRDDLNVS